MLQNIISVCYIQQLLANTHTHTQFTLQQNNTHLNSKQTNFQTLTNTYIHTHKQTRTHIDTKRLEMMNVYFEVFTLCREQKCYYTFKIVFNGICYLFRTVTHSPSVS